ncbi:hypothetical protein IQ22_04726 [Pseudomonas duriflava]|uniref:Uncharacterized protein n=1 Tax=Pseudomonas duriflava TaxID=459528 RepID=A0A562PJQ9_9PSED|nr:hypothetical protein IQ22_04726 [Pseudomonas duriflava]
MIDGSKFKAVNNLDRSFTSAKLKRQMEEIESSINRYLMALDTQHHLSVAHEVTNVGLDRAQLSLMAKQAGEAIASEMLSAVADRGYCESEEILACHDAIIIAYVPKPMTSADKADERLNNDAFIYDSAKNEYICPAG